MSAKNLTLVTGAGGFIGGWVAETLYLQGKPVRAGVHGWAGAARPARFPMEIVECDIMNPRQLEEVMQGVGCVVHCAKGPYDTIPQSTRNVLEAATHLGVERIVHVSTAEVFGAQTGQIDESFPCVSMNDMYADNKIRAEEICQEYIAKGFPISIVRPPIVYGPFSKTFTVNIAYKLLSGNWGIYKGLANGTCNLIYVTDLVDGILRASECDVAIGEVFILNGSDLPTWNEYFTRFNDALGLPPLKVYEPQSIGVTTKLKEPLRNAIKFARDHFERAIKQMAAKQPLVRRLMKFVETGMKTTPRLHDLKLYQREATYLHEKARRVLGFQPAVGLDQGLRLSVQWLEQIGMRQFQYTKGAR